MSKYLRRYETYEEMIMEVTKQRMIIIIIRIVRVLDVKEVAYELSGPFSKVGASQADNDSSHPPENFNRNVFLAKIFDFIILYSCRSLYN